MKESKVVSIILNYSKYELTLRLLKNLLNKDYKGYIVIVDNNSPNNSYEILKREIIETDKVKIIKNNENLGYANGNNYGINYALETFYDIDYIAILNPDVILNEKFSFEELLIKLDSQEEIAGISPRQNLNGDLTIKNIGWKYPNYFMMLTSNSLLLRPFLKLNFYREEDLQNIKGNVMDVEVLPGSFFIMKRKVFEEIKFFDENTFMYAEEIILAAKIKKIKKRFVVDLSEEYFHDHQVKDNDLLCYKNLIKDYGYRYNSQVYFIKNYLSVNILQLIIFKLACYFRRFFEIPLILLLKNMRMR